MSSDEVTRVLAPSPGEIRDQLAQSLVANLLGPEGGDFEELVTDTAVHEYYLVGMLAPRRQRPDADNFEGQQDELVVEGSAEPEEVAPDVGVPPGAGSTAGWRLFPSSLGMTFGVAGEASEVELRAEWGHYERVRVETGTEESKRGWRRTPAGGTCALPLVEGSFGPLVPDLTYGEVILRGEIHRMGDQWVVTAFMVNDQEEQRARRDEFWLFQARLSVQDGEGRAVFRRPHLNSSAGPTSAGQEEQRALEMGFRRQVEFAVGHGTGVHAELDSADCRRAVRVTTTAIPDAEVPRTDPPSASDFPALGDVELDMAVLAKASDQELAQRLRPLVVAYRSWIVEQRARISNPSAFLSGLEEVAAATLDRAEEAARRIEAGIDLLDAAKEGYDPQAAQAFRFANEAMWLQRIHTLAATRRRADPETDLEGVLAEVDQPQARTWYPFQAAFVLLNLPSLANPGHPERGPGAQGLVDLLWFPTGGGKTEAYLGLTAFVLAMRRLQGTVGGYDGGEGVGVLMRYTLRLLTVQQFQRAAALLCACEQLRTDRASRGDHRLGERPFRLGLWVGQAVTPTTGSQAAKAIEEARGISAYGRQSNPVQLTSCPWCGAPVSVSKDADFDPIRRRTLLYCGDPLGRCPFTRRQAPGEGLPVLTVDDEIYRLVPGMVIATADKFAQLPWQGPARALFGRVDRRCERHGWRHPDLDQRDDERDSHPRRANHPAARTVEAGPLRPPDLIIQDELHLIAGPLGSLMGLYETAVDALSSWELDGHQIRPKVVASTATVRRAEDQAYQVFWRRLDIFPPPGLDAADSFFAVQRDPASVPGRRYLGVCAPGRRMKAVEIRIYVALLGAAQALFERYGEAADPWMTLVGYFSALRELAGMRRLVDDDVSTRLAQAPAGRPGQARRLLYQDRIRELTSRMASSDIPEVLEQLSVQFHPVEGSSGPEGSTRAQRTRGWQRPVDVLLATNMISVGVDVPRLGLMVVGGQPKATAEYIQATSRVGRSPRGPGLVVTVLNWARPRDLSYYETFEHFHATLARHVEALSVTPFASRALDRGLTAVAMSLVRHRDDSTNPNPAPETLSPHVVGQEAITALRARAEAVTSRSAVGDEVARALKSRLDAWLQQQKRPGMVLGYRDRKDGKTVGLLQAPGETRWNMWTCPTSLREVEAGINLLLTDGPSPSVREGPEYEFIPRAKKGAANDDAAPAQSGGGSSPNSRTVEGIEGGP